MLLGPEAVQALAELDEVDRVVNAVVGEAGIYAGLAAVKAGKVPFTLIRSQLLLAETR